MRSRHSQAEGATTPLGPGSEAITLRFANQRKSDDSAARDDSHETAAGHLRNALQICELAVPGDLPASGPADFAAVRDRIRRALLLIESPSLIVTYDVTPAGKAELERPGELAAMLPPALPRAVACKYCGCEQESACSVRVDQLSDDARAAVELYYLERNGELPDVVPCWWVSINPPVCSAPACAASLREWQTSRRAPEWGGPV